MRRVLHVGCGRKSLRHIPPFFQDGTWSEVRLDIDPDVKPDIIGTMTDMAAVESGSVDAVFSSHNIEHLFAHEVPIALGEFRRVLSPDGFALITCPDLQAVAQLVAQDKLLEPAYQSRKGPISPLDILYGHGASIAAGNHYMAHRGGFTLRTLGEALRSAGFLRVAGQRRPQYFDLWALGVVAPIQSDALKAMARLLLPAPLRQA